MKKYIYTILLLIAAFCANAQSDPAPTNPESSSLLGFRQIMGSDTQHYAFQDDGWLLFAGRSWVNKYFIKKSDSIHYATIAKVKATVDSLQNILLTGGNTFTGNNHFHGIDTIDNITLNHVTFTNNVQLGDNNISTVNGNYSTTGSNGQFNSSYGGYSAVFNHSGLAASNIDGSINVYYEYGKILFFGNTPSNDLWGQVISPYLGSDITKENKFFTLPNKAGGSYTLATTGDNISEFANDAGYISSGSVPTYTASNGIIKTGTNFTLDTAFSHAVVQPQINTLAGRIAGNTVNIATNTAAISAETTRATAAEATNATNIANNSTAITTETSRATNAEASNYTAIGLKAPRILGSLPATGSTTLLATDTIPLAISKLNNRQSLDSALFIKRTAGAVHVASIAAIIAYSNLATQIILSDTLAGKVSPIFNYYPSSTAVIDSGVVLPATGKGGGRWVRNYAGGPVFPEWWGAIPYQSAYVTSPVDSRKALQSAINFQGYRNSTVEIDRGFYSSGDLKLGENTKIVGLTTLWPSQKNSTHTDSTIYKNQSFIKFYNNSNGFVSDTLAVLPYRTQGGHIENLGIFGTDKNGGKTGLVLHQTVNSTTLSHTTGLWYVINCYFAGWAVAEDGLNSADTWHHQYDHYSDVKTAIIGGSGQTYVNFCDFFNIDEWGFIGNSTLGDIFANNEVETRYCAQYPVLLQGQNSIVHDNLFFTNKKSVKLASTATGAIIDDNQFMQNSDVDITVDGAADINIHDNMHLKSFISGAYDYAANPVTLNTSAPVIYVRQASRTKIHDEHISVNTTYTGTPAELDTLTNAAVANNTMYGFAYIDERAFTAPGTTYQAAYDIGARSIAGTLNATGVINSTGINNTGTVVSTGIISSTGGNMVANNYTFNADQTYSVGGSTKEAASVYTASVNSNSGSALSIGSNGPNSIFIKVNSASIWKFDSSNNFYPVVDKSYNLGSATNRILTGYFNGLYVTGLSAGTAGMDSLVTYNSSTKLLGKVAASSYALTGAIQFNHTIFTPTTGTTVTLVDKQANIINPAGTLAALTIAAPASPANNDVVKITFEQSVTTVTWPSAFVSPQTSVSGRTTVTYVYDSAAGKWY